MSMLTEGIGDVGGAGAAATGVWGGRGRSRRLQPDDAMAMAATMPRDTARTTFKRGSLQARRVHRAPCLAQARGSLAKEAAASRSIVPQIGLGPRRSRELWV